MNNQLMKKTEPWTEVQAQHPAPAFQSEPSLDPQTDSVLDYWRILRQRKMLLVVMGALGLAAGIGFSFVQRPMYRAVTALEIQDNKDDVLASKMLNQGSEASSVDAATDVQTQMRILQSKTLMSRALDRLQTANETTDHRKPAAENSWMRLVNGPQLPERREEVLEKSAKQLKISQSGQTRIVEVSFEANNPLQAARFANALTSEFIQANLQSRLELSRRTTDLLMGQLEDLRSKLRVSEDALQTYARQQGLIYTNDNQSISGEKLKQLQTELSKAEGDRVEKQSRSEVAHSATIEAVPYVMDDSNLRTMESTLNDLRRQEADLKVIFKPDYSKTRRIRAEIESLEAAIATKRTEIVSRVDHELAESQRREQLIAGAYTKQMRSVADDSEKSIQYDLLKHEVDTNRQIYQAMLQRVKESSVASAMKATNVRILDVATPPELPFKPNRPINAAAGFMFGLVVGAVVIVVKTRTNGNVQEPGDVGHLLGVPELGVIPAAEANRKRLGATQSLFPAARSLEGPETAIGYPENSSVIADSFRAVLASILFVGGQRRQQILVVTSANPGEGKTTTVANLAATLANMNRKVLLIDGDIRSPRLHTIFKLQNSEGLTTVLQKLALHEVPAFEREIQKTDIPNLHVLTSGPSVESGADLLSSSFIPSLLTRFREQYDMILIDTPPMLMMPDARFLGRVADGTVLIARAGRTGRDAIQAACRRLLQDRIPVVGVVLNDWNAKLSAYSYYSNYKDSSAGQPGAVVNMAGA